MTNPTAPTSSDMRDRTCLITGATSGIGYITARELARRGATVALVARSPERAAASVTRIRQETGNNAVDFLLADLSSLEQVRSLAKEVTARYERLHVLINNAGAVFWSRQETADGLEMTFALNILSPFLLTNLLLPALQASAPARIITVASMAHAGAHIPFDDLQQQHHRYRGLRVYGQSKLADILFSYELARRLKGQAVTANTLHPGFVATNFGKSGPFMRLAMTLVSPFAISPERGAETTVYLATSPEIAATSGVYFVKQKPARSSAASYDEESARRLWTVCEQLTGLA